jgi:hypothetical protein
MIFSHYLMLFVHSKNAKAEEATAVEEESIKVLPQGVSSPIISKGELYETPDFSLIVPAGFELILDTAPVGPQKSFGTQPLTTFRILLFERDGPESYPALQKYLVCSHQHCIQAYAAFEKKKKKKKKKKTRLVQCSSTMGDHSICL